MGGVAELVAPLPRPPLCLQQAVHGADRAHVAPLVEQRGHHPGRRCVEEPLGVQHREHTRSLGIAEGPRRRGPGHLLGRSGRTPATLKRRPRDPERSARLALAHDRDQLPRRGQHHLSLSPGISGSIPSARESFFGPRSPSRPAPGADAGGSSPRAGPRSRSRGGGGPGDPGACRRALPLPAGAAMRQGARSTGPLGAGAPRSLLARWPGRPRPGTSA